MNFDKNGVFLTLYPRCFLPFNHPLRLVLSPAPLRPFHCSFASCFSTLSKSLVKEPRTEKCENDVQSWGERQKKRASCCFSLRFSFPGTSPKRQIWKLFWSCFLTLMYPNVFAMKQIGLSRGLWGAGIRNSGFLYVGVRKYRNLSTLKYLITVYVFFANFPLRRVNHNESFHWHVEHSNWYIPYFSLFLFAL